MAGAGGQRRHSHNRYQNPIACDSESVNRELQRKTPFPRRGIGRRARQTRHASRLVSSRWLANRKLRLGQEFRLDDERLKRGAEATPGSVS